MAISWVPCLVSRWKGRAHSRWHSWMCIKDKCCLYHLRLDQSVPWDCSHSFWLLFLRCGGFLLVFTLFWFWSHRTEVIVCTHHGTDIQINSTGCFFLHYSCELSPELSSSQVGHTCYTSLHLYFIQFFFNNGKINLTVVLNQKYPFSSLFLTAPPAPKKKILNNMGACAFRFSCSCFFPSDLKS